VAIVTAGGCWAQDVLYEKSHRVVEERRPLAVEGPNQPPGIFMIAEARKEAACGICGFFTEHS
jgi:hypothetical protein